MGELKPGWKRVKFGQVVRLNRETCKDPTSEGIERVIGLEHLEPGDLRVRSWTDLADGTTFTNRVRPGQVLFGKRRAYQRKVAVADFDAICSGDIYVFETADPTRLLPELLPYICQTDAFFEHAVGTSAGSLSPRTNWSSLAEYEFALPPLEEQHRLAALLRALDRTRQRYRDLASAAERALVATRGSLLDAAWRSSTRSHLERVAKGQYGIVDGPFGSNLKSVHFRDRGHPVISSSMFSSGKFSPSIGDYKYVDSEKFEQLRRNRAVAGDILVVLIGFNCGTVAVLPDDHAPGVITQNCLKITVDEGIARRDFVVEALRWLKESGRAERLVTTTQQRALSLGRLRKAEIPLPSLDVQDSVLDTLRELDRGRQNAAEREAGLLRSLNHGVNKLVGQ